MKNKTSFSALDIGKGENFRNDWNDRAKNLGAVEASSFGPETSHVFADVFASGIAMALREKLNLQPRDVVLDLGCGPGKIAFYLAPHVYKLVGVDVSDVMLSAAKSRCKKLKNTKFIRNNGQDIRALPSESFDVAFSYACFIHLPEAYQDRYIKEMLRVVKPGGKVLTIARYGQKHKKFLYTFTGSNFSEKRLRKLRANPLVADANFIEVLRHEELATDCNTRRWISITKK